MKFQLIVGSVRNGRRGKKVADWAFEYLLEKVKQRVGDEFEIELLDLALWNLPVYQEPTPEVAERWCAKIAEADGYMIVTPEYNHGYPASVKDALDYPYNEWNRKPIGFIGYSIGVGAGIRAIEQLREVAIELQMAPVRPSVNIAFVESAFDELGKIKEERIPANLDKLLDEMLWWGKALKKARDETSVST